jgi:hypothetical protein
MSKLQGNIDGWYWNEEKFWEKTVKEDDTTCWTWLGAHHPTSSLMGAYRKKNGKMTTQMTQARRISHYIHFGESIAEHRLTHTCGNHWCVNPYHLEKKHNLRLGKELK